MNEVGQIDIDQITMPLTSTVFNELVSSVIDDVVLREKFENLASTFFLEAVSQNIENARKRVSPSETIIMALTQTSMESGEQVGVLLRPRKKTLH